MVLSQLGNTLAKQSKKRGRPHADQTAHEALDPGVLSRKIALQVLARVEDDGAFSNLLLSQVLDEHSALTHQDRGFITDLVYGTLRMQRACQAVIDRYVTDRPPPAANRALRIGTYQLLYRSDIPTYAAVSTTVEAAPKRFRGLINAVLRKISTASVEFSSAPEELSYPTWVYKLFVRDFGENEAHAALERMNAPAEPRQRSDGYSQDIASQWVSELVGAGPNDRVLDMCAAPGGKATWIAKKAAYVVASDLQHHRVGLIQDNAARYGNGRVAPVTADGRALPFPSQVFDHVLLDAPCSGLGVLRRRADARWRMQPNSIEQLAALQRSLVDAAVDQVKVGGILTYSVCTVTREETLDIDSYIGSQYPELEPALEVVAPWQQHGRGAVLLPHWADTDGMSIFRYHRSK